MKYETEWIRIGQPRPYAAEINERLVTFEGRPSRTEVIEILKLKERQEQWSDETVKELTEIEPCKWRVVTTRPFTD